VTEPVLRNSGKPLQIAKFSDDQERDDHGRFAGSGGGGGALHEVTSGSPPYGPNTFRVTPGVAAAGESPFMITSSGPYGIETTRGGDTIEAAIANANRMAGVGESSPVQDLKGAASLEETTWHFVGDRAFSEIAISSEPTAPRQYTVSWSDREGKYNTDVENGQSDHARVGSFDRPDDALHAADDHFQEHAASDQL
jgi:hypothetical protein